MSRPVKQPVSSFNSAYGCVIMVAAVLVFGGIIGWSTYTYFVQDKVIGGLTAESPAPLPSAEIPPPALADLLQRLTNFSTAATSGQPAELRLTLAELNALLPLAPDTGSGTYAGKIYFLRTDPAANNLIAQSSLPLNKKFWEEGHRYLNGELTFTIYVHEHGPDAKVADVKVPGKDVEPGLIRDMGRWPWMAPYQQGALAPVLKAIQRAEVTSEGLLLSTQKK